MADESNFNEIHRALGRIEGKLDSMRSEQDKRDKRVEKLEERADVHDQRYWKAAGALGVLSLAWGFVVKHIPINFG